MCLAIIFLVADPLNHSCNSSVWANSSTSDRTYFLGNGVFCIPFSLVPVPLYLFIKLDTGTPEFPVTLLIFFRITPFSSPLRHDILILSAPLLPSGIFLRKLAPSTLVLHSSPETDLPVLWSVIVWRSWSVSCPNHKWAASSSQAHLVLEESVGWN